MYIGKGGLSGQTLDDPGILNAMATASPLNAQLSCSWLWRPPDPSTNDPFFQQFALQGQNFFVAAGDAAKWSKSGFVWPADDPFITSVGGTDLTTASAGGPWASETAWSSSGGGITPNNFAIPSWQVAAAASCTSCSQTLRNGPDISANSNYTFYVCADQTSCTANLYGGTSFAAPMWAGFLALVNQQAVANGQPPLGFLNPALYILGGSSYSADFHDITSGSNGFQATAGYDLVTGIGSPTGQALVDSLAGTSSGSFTVTDAPKVVTVTRGGAPARSKITTITTGGFNSAISLSASGQGVGVQLLFNPSTIPAPGAGHAGMLIKVSAAATAGTRTITITAKGGGVTQTTTLTLTIK
jgi:kumamolisin